MARPTDKGLISKSKLTAIGDQVRRLTGTSTQYTPDGMAQALANYQPGGGTTIDVVVTSRYPSRQQIDVEKTYCKYYEPGYVCKIELTMEMLQAREIAAGSNYVLATVTRYSCYFRELYGSSSGGALLNNTSPLSVTFNGNEVNTLSCNIQGSDIRITNTSAQPLSLSVGDKFYVSGVWRCEFI